MTYLKRRKSPPWTAYHTHMTPGGRFIEIDGPWRDCLSPFCIAAEAKYQAALRQPFEVSPGQFVRYIGPV